MKRADIIIPCYNEEDVIDLLFEKITQVTRSITNIQFYFIFIDDGSSDRTLEKIKSFVEECPFVEYISFSRNFGKEAAMYAGIQTSKGDFVMIMDADMQNPPDLIPEMLSAVEGDYDCCVACRNRQGDARTKSFFARTFYKIINKISDVEMKDGAGDFRIFTRQVANAILAMSEVQRFSKGIFSWVGFQTKWIYYDNAPRAAGVSKWSVWKLFKYAIEGITAFSVVPLRIASVLGALISISSFVYLLYISFKTLIFGVDLPGYASTIGFILLTGGVTIMSLGILGEYIAKIYIEVKKRPIYIVKESNQSGMREKE